MKHGKRVSRGGNRSQRWTIVTLGVLAGLVTIAGLSAGTTPPPEAIVAGDYIVLANNDLGMHCMMRDFSHFMILPPYNNIQAVVIHRGEEPQIIGLSQSTGFTVNYSIPSNTHSSTKSNFWKYDQALLGVDLPPDVGLTGEGMSGILSPQLRRWKVFGIPITPEDDAGRNNPYPLATITVHRQGMGVVAQTQTVVPVSWEISCNACHGDPQPGVNVELDVLRDHDRLHNTHLEDSQPVFCAQCHADPVLDAPGQAGIPSFSTAMHGAHADRMGGLPPSFENECYACHPGRRAQCQRDVHFAVGMDCHSCHGRMSDVGSPGRTPWVDEPRCADCHSRPGFSFEQPGTLFRESIGHGGVGCFACHGSPHAITPSTTATDNLQAILHQGFPGVISQCTVCHTQMPDEPFFHRVGD